MAIDAVWIQKLFKPVGWHPADHHKPPETANTKPENIMKLIEIVADYVEKNNYDGLYNPHAECACSTLWSVPKNINGETPYGLLRQQHRRQCVRQPMRNLQAQFPMPDTVFPAWVQP